MGVLGLVVLASRLFALDPVERGIAVTVVTLAVLVGLEARRGGPLNRVLSLTPLVYLGQISYGTYLWHWPVVVIAERFVSLRPGFLALVVAAVASGLAALSAALVEMPIRRSAVLDRVRWPVVASGLSISVVAALVLVPVVMRPGFARVVNDTARLRGTAGVSPGLLDALTPVPQWFDQKKVHDEAYYHRSVACPTGTPTNVPCTVRRGKGPHVLLLGDSNGIMIAGPLGRAAEKADLTLTLGVQNGCPWQLGIDAMVVIKDRAGCRASKARIYADLKAIDPDIVVVMNAFTLQDLGDVPYSDAQRRKEFELTTASARALTATGASLMIIEPLPRSRGADPLDCLATATYVEACRFRAQPGPSPIEVHERALARELPRVSTLDLDRDACPLLPVCDPIIGTRSCGGTPRTSPAAMRPRSTTSSWPGCDVRASYRLRRADDARRRRAVQSRRASTSA